MDSLRYWVLEMHVDGFRFDLASTLAREFYDVDRLCAFFDLVQQDPVVSQVKLIAEPWDVGEGGYQVGNFPGLWTEWNGKYRDTVRDYWRGEPATLGEFASRLTGSSDLYEATGRRPERQHQLRHRPRRLHAATTWSPTTRSTTRPTARTTATARATTGPGTAAWRARPTTRRSSTLRGRQMRNILATLMLSPGHADDRARRRDRPHPARQQQRLLPGLRDCPGWTGRCAETNSRPARRSPARSTALRKDHPVFRRRRFFDGRPIRSGDEVRDIAWLTPAGKEMTPEDWGGDFGKSIAVFLNGEAIPEPERPRRAGRRRLVPAVLQRPRPRGRLRHPARRLRRRVDRRAGHHRSHRRTRAGGARRRRGLAARPGAARAA